MKNYQKFLGVVVVIIVSSFLIGCSSTYQMERTTTTYKDGKVVVVEKPIQQQYYQSSGFYQYPSRSYYPSFYSSYRHSNGYRRYFRPVRHGAVGVRQDIVRVRGGHSGFYPTKKSSINIKSSSSSRTRSTGDRSRRGR